MPNWRPAFLVGFTGLRGAVSLAAALSIPLTLDGVDFPHRDLILFATICAIVATLVGQGSILPRVVDWLGLARVGAREEAANKRAEQAARVDGIDAVLAMLDADSARVAASPATHEALRRFHADRRATMAVTADAATPDNPVADATALQLRLIDSERAAIASAYMGNRITDEARRRIERELDVEEAMIHHVRESSSVAVVAEDP